MGYRMRWGESWWPGLLGLVWAHVSIWQYCERNPTNSSRIGGTTAAATNISPCWDFEDKMNLLSFFLVPEAAGG